MKHDTRNMKLVSKV